MVPHRDHITHSHPSTGTPRITNLGVAHRATGVGTRPEKAAHRMSLLLRALAHPLTCLRAHRRNRILRALPPIPAEHPVRTVPAGDEARIRAYLTGRGVSL